MFKNFWNKLCNNIKPKEKVEVEEEEESITIKIGDFFWFLWLEDGFIIRTSGTITAVNSEEKYIEIQTSEVVKKSDTEGNSMNEKLETLLKPHRIYLDWIIKGGQVYRNTAMDL